MKWSIFILGGVFTLSWSSLVEAFGSSHNKVLLKDVQTITLHRGKMTAGRRTSPVPQLNCVGGNACGDYEPAVVQCTNSGFDGMDVQWKCQADLPSKLRFGELNVYCEGFAYPDDPYVLKGSCGLEYELYYTNIHSNRDRGEQWQARESYKSTTFSPEAILLCFGIIFVVAFFCVGLCIHLGNSGNARRDEPPPPYRASAHDHRPSGGGGGPGSGSGGGGGFGGGWGSGWGSGRSNRNHDKPTDGEGFRPGFWTGVGVGGAAAYLATRERESTRRQQPTYTTSAPSHSSYSGGFGASSSSSSSSSTRTATGFGGTRRR
ncbi:hypothetical protein B0O80DRAFT_432320 [Mortierella sp. GBAus27b]|nr:hypothetical protein B0O80DRAFT_432320 [Mortierella sp. GBAus27b]